MDRLSPRPRGHAALILIAFLALVVFAIVGLRMCRGPILRAAFSGGGPPGRADVTNSPSERGGIQLDRDYPVPPDAYLDKDAGGIQMMVPEPNPPTHEPRSRHEYEADPSARPRVLRFLAPGATLRVYRVVHERERKVPTYWVNALVTEPGGSTVDVGLDWSIMIPAAAGATK